MIVRNSGTKSTDFALNRKTEAGRIYGNTLANMISSGAHAGFKATALSKTDKHPYYTDQEALVYNPYPDYTGSHYKTHNKGEYVICDGPDGGIEDVMVFSGHPKIFGYPPIGAYYMLDIDSNLCFERETRLGPYGYIEGSTETSSAKNWDVVDWGSLQEQCAEKNAGRFGVPITAVGTLRGNSSVPYGNATVKPKRAQENEMLERNMQNARSARIRRAFEKERYIERDQKIARDEDSMLHGLQGQSDRSHVQTRTAVLLRADSGKEWTENDKQNVRSMVTELSLRSGGEYQVFLLLQILDDSIPLFSDPAAYSATLRANVPQEFWSMTILYNDRIMKELYPKIALTHQDARDSHWLPVQKFAQDYPNFDYYWNWELDSRYTGHHYKLLENLGMFADMQPRKGLWERNERFYIPQLYGAYDSQFRYAVELKYAGSSTVWGAYKTTSVVHPVGPVPPVAEATDDNYEWGLLEHADFISLAPIFNPVGTKWTNKDDVWGYDGPEGTPRRASVIKQCRCSKKLLEIMHAENLEGNHISSEMAPPTVALLHGLKAVYAPHPVFLDREWEGRSLERWFNPGEKGESGSHENSPFGEGVDERFKGFSWGQKAEVPRKIYNHWMGREDGGMGGKEASDIEPLDFVILTDLQWEHTHGRVCLPPMLLYPIN